MRFFGLLLLFTSTFNSVELLAKIDNRNRIQIPAQLSKGAHKLRIKNIRSGKEAIFNLSGKTSLTIQEVLRKLKDKSQHFEPEFSQLKFKNSWRPAPANLQDGGSKRRSLVYDQPVWIPLNHNAVEQEDGSTLYVLGGDTARSYTPTQAQKKRHIREQSPIKRLFEIGWKALQFQKNKVALKAFNRILGQRKSISPLQMSQAFLGRGVAYYNMNDCEKAEKSFQFAARSPKYQEDVRYYRAVCRMESEPEWSENVFNEIIQEDHPRYADSARFFKGELAEADGRFDEADYAYRDIVDFSDNPQLVAAARKKLMGLRERMIEYNNRRRVFTGALSLITGYDSNVVSLPQSVDPSARNLSSESSLAYNALLFMDLRMPWFGTFVPNTNYTAYMAQYTNSEINTANGVLMHNVYLGFKQTFAEESYWGLGTAYNTIFLGKAFSGSEYLRSYSIDYDWVKRYSNSRSAWNVALEFARPQQEPTASSTDLSSTAYQLSWKHRVLHSPPHSFGPGLAMEFKPSAGSENSNWNVELLGLWDGSIRWKNLYFTQEGSLSYAHYYQSSAGRKDYALGYTGSVGKTWTKWLDTRLQFIGKLNYSTDKDNFQYQRAQINFLVSAYF